MVRFKNNLGIGGKSSKAQSKKEENTFSFLKKKNQNEEPVIITSLKSTRQGIHYNGPIISLEDLINKKKELIKNKNEKQKKKEKNNEIQINKSKIKKFSTLINKDEPTCHQCKKTSYERGTMIECCIKSCKKKFCEKCLETKYELEPGSFGFENNEENNDNNDNNEILENNENTKDNVEYGWKCPVCEDICNCAPCRKKKGLEPLGKYLNYIKKNISSQFNSLWDYFIYQRDHNLEDSNLINKNNQKKRKITNKNRTNNKKIKNSINN